MFSEIRWGGGRTNYYQALKVLAAFSCTVQDPASTPEKRNLPSLSDTVVRATPPSRRCSERDAFGTGWPAVFWTVPSIEVCAYAEPEISRSRQRTRKQLESILEKPP